MLRSLPWRATSLVVLAATFAMSSGCRRQAAAPESEPPAAAPARSEAPKPPARPARPPQEKIRERDRYWSQARSQLHSGWLTEAAGAIDKALLLQRQVDPDNKDPALIDLLNLRAMIQEEREDWKGAHKSLAEVVAIQSRLQGEKDPQTAEARQAVDALERRSRLSAAQRGQLLRQAKERTDEVFALYRSNRYQAALAPAREALALRGQVLGEKHPNTLRSLHILATLYKDLGDYPRAEPLYRQANAIARELLGEKHPEYAGQLISLALVYHEMGDYAPAERVYRQALDLTREMVGEEHPDYVRRLSSLAALYGNLGDYARGEALSREARDIARRVLSARDPSYAAILGNLASFYQHLGDYVRAEPLLRQALALRKEAQGEKDPDYGTRLNNLAELYKEMGDDARAEPLLQEALTVYKQTLGDSHPLYANSLNNLAMLYWGRGGYARAEPMLEQALAIRKRALGDNHPLYAISLDNLALLYWARGEYGRAEPLYQQGLAIKKEVLGEKHPSYTTGLNNLAMLYRDMGDYERAGPLYEQALAVTRKALGEKHPDYANSLNNLALFCLDRGNVKRGEKLAHQAVLNTRTRLELTATVQSERQQLAMLTESRLYLDSYLRLAADAQASAADAYAVVLAWKGAVSARQLHQNLLRRARLNAPATVVKLYADLEQATARLAVLSRTGTDAKTTEQLRRDLDRTSDEVEHLQRELARRNEPFRQELRRQRTTPADLCKALPADTALVDVLEYDHYTPPAKGKGRWQWIRRLAAFVVRPDKPVVQLDLGEAGPVTDAIVSWRRSYGLGEKGVAAGKELRRLLWDRLEPHLDGVRTVLLSPDGAAAQLPWGALPGRKPGTYLLEEYAVAVVPMPHLLPSLLAQEPGGSAPPSLLLAGNVDFDAAPGRPAQPALAHAAPQGSRSGGRLRWPSLPGTADEVHKLAETFRKRFPSAAVLTLEETEASEQAVRQGAARYRYLHLATHGFFAGDEVRSAVAPAGAAAADGPFVQREVAGFHPALLSGLVLAGANRPPAAEQDDGILTALEVGALDLGGVELATLSACQTALGEKTSGDGVLGLQRAFQIAGARSVAAGLWKVNDAATALLMERFYDNLWQKKMSKLEALRQAQLWLLREAPKQPGLVRGLARGLDLSEDEEPKENQALPPYFWAAFVLSGDWR